MKSPGLLANGRRFLAFAPTEIIQFGPSRAAFRFDLNLCDARRIERENALDAFAVGNASHGEGFI